MFRDEQSVRMLSLTINDLVYTLVQQELIFILRLAFELTTLL